MPYHPHPHIIICLSIDYNVFIVLQCHLKDLFAEKWRKSMIYYYYYRPQILTSKVDLRTARVKQHNLTSKVGPHTEIIKKCIITEDHGLYGLYKDKG